MSYNLRSSAKGKGISSNGIGGEEKKSRKRKLDELPDEQEKARPAPNKARKNSLNLEKSREEEKVKKSSNNPIVEHERAIRSLHMFLLETFIAEWSIGELNHLDKLIEESGLLERMPGQLEVFYSHAFKKRMELETPRIPFKNNQEKLEKYVDVLVDEHHFDRFFRTSTFDLEDWSVGELPWGVSKLLWLRLTGFDRNEDHRNFAMARMRNESEAVPISQLRHREEPEEMLWKLINEMEALLTKLPRYRPEDSIAKPIEEAFDKLKAVVENQDPSARQTGNVRYADSSSPGRGSATLVDETQENCQQQSPEPGASDDIEL